jgi:lipopolysaccharide export system ATP-binding protein
VAESEVSSVPEVEALLDVREVWVERGGQAVVRGVSLRVKAGTAHALLGPSGAGKSSLFGAIAGEWNVRSGAVCWLGEPMEHLAMWERARKGVGYLPQGTSVLFDLTVIDNLRTFQRWARGTLDVKSVASLTKIDHRLQVRASELSGGERRRLEIARALLAQPKLLVCDEPFSGVDPQGRAEVGELLRSCVEQGIAVLVSDHHVHDALRLADYGHLLVDGQVVESGEARAFSEKASVIAIYL